MSQHENIKSLLSALTRVAGRTSLKYVVSLLTADDALHQKLFWRPSGIFLRIHGITESVKVKDMHLSSGWILMPVIKHLPAGNTTTTVHWVVKAVDYSTLYLEDVGSSFVRNAGTHILDFTFVQRWRKRTCTPRKSRKTGWRCQDNIKMEVLQRHYFSREKNIMLSVASQALSHQWGCPRRWSVPIRIF